MKRYPLYIFDLDGTLFRGDEALPDAIATLEALRREGAAIRYLTNNSTQTRQTYVAKLTRMGFQARVEEVYTSAHGAAMFLEGHVSRACVVGEQGLIDSLVEHGIEVDQRSPQAVVVGLCRTFTYQLMTEAMQPLLDPSVRFIATNCDATYPLESQRLIPGAGSIVAAMKTCCGREPEVVGKPNPYLVNLILADSGIAPKDALVVGDRVDTDIEAGIRAGCPVHLVLSGVTIEAPPGISASPTLADLL